MFTTQLDFSIQAFQRGDPQAFNFIFACYYPSLCFFANRLTAGKCMHEDITQESFIRLWQKHSAFTCENSIKAFLYIITRNACLNFIKHWQRRQKSLSSWSRSWLNDEESVLGKLVRKDLDKELHAAIRALPRECGRIISLSYLEGLKNREIAERLQLSIHTIKNQKARGLQLLKRNLVKKNLLKSELLAMS
jgi:RNA polymerase sigma-70 factor (family 1)